MDCKHKLVIVSCVLFATALVCPIARSEDRVAKPEPPEAPSGWVFLDDDVWESVPDTIARHLHQAWQDATAERFDDASLEMRKAAAVMLFAARRETNVPVKETLMNAVLDLERLASRCGQHTNDLSNLMDHTFARAEYAIARHDIVEASDVWQGNDRDMLRIGNRLKAAAIHVHGGFLWAGADMVDGEVDEVSSAMSIGTALEDGRYRDGKRIQAAMEGLEHATKTLGKLVKGYQRVAEAGVPPLKAVPLPAPDGYVLVEDDVWLVNLDEPGRLFHEARADYAERRYTAAALDLLEASAHLRIEGRRTKTPAIEADLFASADALRNLARTFEDGKPVPMKRLNNVFATAQYNLARANLRAAADATAKADERQARQTLHAALTNLREGFVWSGHEMEADTLAMVTRVEPLCASMAKSVGWDKSEVAQAVKFVQAEVDRLGHEL